MGMSEKTIAMIGYDISNLSGYIRELEESNEKWEDGIPAYSLNFTNNNIGYDCHTKSMFGEVIFDTDDAGATEEGTGTKYCIEDFDKKRKAIFAKYKQFIFDHTKISDRDEPEFVLKFITWFE